MTSQNKRVKNKFLLLGVLLLGALFFYLRKEKAPETAQIPQKPIDFAPTPTIPQKQQVVAVNGVPVKNEQAVQAQNDLTKNLNDLEKKQFQVFTEIMLSKNDNDPRLDKDLKHLSANLKKALENQYALLPDERRNEKGLVVFLIARDVNSPEDLQFIESIYRESPCLSLANCQVRGAEDPHFSGMNEVSLVYPQVAGLFQLESQLKSRPQLLQDPNFRNQMQNLLRSAEQFPVPSVQKRAKDFKEKYGL